MGTSEPKSWAEIFAAELVVDGERIPFERANVVQAAAT
jgi:hypothetical protein